MLRRELSKYYTPAYVAHMIVEKTNDLLGSTITEFLEPSAGGGVFLDFLPEGTKAYDIEPEDKRIIKQNFLELDIPYKKGRCIIGNPPFGVNTNSKCKKSGNVYAKFVSKSMKLCDYISFILPVSCHDNPVRFYQFELIHSEILPLLWDKKIKTCFNIYRRPLVLLKKPSFSLEMVKITEDRNGRMINGGDIVICKYGSIGKECDTHNYSGKMIFTINEKYKQQVIELLRKTNYLEVFGNTYCSVPSLVSWRVLRYIKQMIPEIY